MDKPKTVVDTLKATRKLLATPTGWMQGSFQGGYTEIPVNGGRDAGGWIEGRYTRFCAVGALRTVDGPKEAAARRILAALVRAGDEDAVILADGVQRNTRKERDEWDIIAWNDDTSRKKTHVLKLFDKAIEIAEQQ